MGRRVRTARAVLIVVLLCLITASEADARLRIEAPGLTPEFRPKVHDYTLPCDDPIALAVRAPGPAEARIGGRSWSGETASRRLRLTEGQAIRIVKRTKSGRRVRYFIRCLPASFPDYSFKRSGEPEARFYMITPNLITPNDPAPADNYVIIFDRWGVPIWWYSSPVRTIDAKVLDDGTIAWSRYFGGGFGTNPDGAYEFHRASGKRIGTLEAVGSVTDFHDLQVNSRGNFLIFTYRPRAGVDTSAFGGDADATVLDSVVQELTPQGKLVSEWSTQGHIDLSETGRWWGDLLALGEPYDTTHINAVEPLAGGDFLISLRNTDGVYRIDGQTGDVEWKLGGEQTPESLEVRRDPFGGQPLGGQHDVRLLDGGDISIYDNASNLARPPRAVRFRIADNVATLVTSVSDAEAPRSICCGSTRVVGKSFLTSWAPFPLVTEADSSGRRTFRLHLGDYFSYRAVPISGELTRTQLRAGMNKQVAPKN
jgi:hypothetical protein